VPTEATHWIRSVAYSPDGKHVVSASDKGAIFLWGATKTKVSKVHLETVDSQILSIAFSKNGKYIVSGSAYHQVQLWEQNSGKSLGAPLGQLTSPVNCVACSPDSKIVAAGTKDGTVHLWDFETHGPKREPFLTHTNIITCLAVSPNADILVFASKTDNNTYWWDTHAHTSIGASALDSKADGVISLAFCPDSSKVGSISAYGFIDLWSSETYQLLIKMEQLNEPVSDLDLLDFSPDGKQVILFTANGLHYIWDVSSGKKVKSSAGVSLLEDDKMQSFIDGQWSNGKAIGAKAWRYPVENPQFGTWVYVDGHIVRTDSNGVTIIAKVDSELLWYH
jgi:WD40 repeat protein